MDFGRTKHAPVSCGDKDSQRPFKRLPRHALGHRTYEKTGWLPDDSEIKTLLNNLQVP